MNPSDFMRMQLATVGIFLDEPRDPVAHRPPRCQAVEPEPVDRDLVREILVAAGASERDLDWMVASCPSVEHALTYHPTIRQAYCEMCRRVWEVDGEGCKRCRPRYGFFNSVGLPDE